MEEETLQRLVPVLEGELYEELLNRYERILVYAGQLQEKTRQQKLLSEKSAVLEHDNNRLRDLLALERSYNLLLERALESLGVLTPRTPGSDEQV